MIMATRGETPHWVKQERRKEELVYMVLALLLLLLAAAPRNERRLFVFPRSPGPAETINAPDQTGLRDAIFAFFDDKPEHRKKDREPVFPDRGIDPWRDLLWEGGMPVGVDVAMVNDEIPAPPEEGQPPAKKKRRPGGILAFLFPSNQAYGVPLSIARPVPEPASWLLMMLGVGAMGLNLRAVRRRQLAARAVRLFYQKQAMRG